MRTKKAIINMFVSTIGEFVTIICAFILPRLILEAFGSGPNGIISSITQFMNCVILLRAGLGGVTRAALFKPLAENNTEKISKIVKATELFMKKIAFIFLALLILFAVIYPFIIKTNYNWIYIFSLVLIIGLSTFAQNYFGVTYGILIEADQKQYIVTIINTITTIINTIIASFLIIFGLDIHIVKLGSAIIFAINPILLRYYARRKYKIITNIEPDNSALSQRWDAFAQQASAFINNNTDVMVLTCFCNIKEVSVYTVYHMVTQGLYKVIFTISNGINAAFGNMIAKNEKKALETNVKVFEFILFNLSTLLFSCGALLIVPFVLIYTKGITDVSYSRPIVGYLMCINMYLFCIRIPYQMVSEAAGHFKQTRNGAIFEGFLNIFLSIVLVYKFGLIGVTVGTFFALLFRTIQYTTYTSKNILNRSLKIIIKRIIVNLFQLMLIIALYSLLPIKIINNYFDWFIYSIQVFILAFLVIGISAGIIFNDELLILINKIKKLNNNKK